MSQESTRVRELLVLPFFQESSSQDDVDRLFEVASVVLVETSKVTSSVPIPARRIMPDCACK